MPDKKRIICPRCEQDYLYYYKPDTINETIILCPECDAVWMLGKPLVYGVYNIDFYDYTKFMQNRNTEPTWNKRIYESPVYEDDLKDDDV
ncbi:hypothetical protein LVJ83_11115 [Uruburuella testudinis]|uniref:Uncharacterized protein n=1 Tax=Uruburuella testudinis TaxID=1282863 RepID=A0ABY4DRW5_9NEIS|nr:hypothetical protein [Uruburuella testudinis]UOO81479.1 hypothetical protein LVJ83_11115 [Uruburuella testudinis]